MDTYMLVGLAWVVVIVVGDWLVARWLRDDEQDGEARASPARGTRTATERRTDQTIRPRTGAAGESACDAESRADVAMRRAAAAPCAAGSGGVAGSAAPPAVSGDDSTEARP